MNWKLPATMLLTAILIVLGYHWGGQRYETRTVDEFEPMVESTAVEEAPVSDDNLFASFPYFHADYSDRYEQYQLKMPELDTGTIVWHVNAGLDHAPYALVSETEGEHPLLVNKQHKLPDDYEPAELVVIHSNILATPGTADAFKRMRSAAMQEGVYIEASAGYRSFERQKELFDTEELYKGTETAEQTVARPGFGEHSTGRALHIVDRNYTFDSFDEMPEFDWLMENCADYGFILRYGEDAEHITGFDYEPYHFTFVGRDIALDMREKHIVTLEEYIARGLAPADDTPIDDRTTVVIVTGNGGVGDNILESGMALRLKERLEVENIRVVMSQNVRDIENETKAAAFIGINQTGSPSGAVVRFDSDRPESRDLAETVSSRLSWSGLPAESIDNFDDNKIAPTRLKEVPAIVIETTAAYEHLTPLEYSDQLAKSISDAVIAHLGLRKMYLTFDDGPSAKNTPIVLDILKEKGVKATFFVIGEMAEQNPQLLQRIVAEGHTVGIHCYSHDYNELYASKESFVNDFYKAREAVKEITGLEPVIYRFPGGSINHYNKEVRGQIIDEMDKLGFVYFDWNISVDDAVRGVKTGDLMRNIEASTRHRYAVLLMHDAYPYIAEELSDVINYFSDYQMNVIDDDTNPVHL